MQPNITSHFSATSRMDNELSGEWVGSIEETDERALQWFAINLMTHNLHNKGLVSGTAVIVSIYEEQTTCLVTYFMTKIHFYFILCSFKLGRCRRRGSKYYICNPKQGTICQF